MSTEARSGGALAAALLCLCLPASASASTVIGGDLSLTPNTIGINDTATNRTATTGGPPVTSPIDGVIVQLRVKRGATGAAPGTYAYRILSGTPPTYTARPATVNGVNTPIPWTASAPAGIENFNPVDGAARPAGIPIAAGERIGFWESSGVPVYLNAGSGFLDYTMSDHTSGPLAYNQNIPNYTLLAQATIEPDADHDGYGDETQDQCATDPTTQAVCQADVSITKAASPDPVPVGGDLTYTITVTNASGTNPASSVTVNDTLPSGVTFKSSTPSQGTCSGSSTVTCELGTLGPGGTATVQIVVTPTTAGTLSNTANVASSTPDPTSTNDSSTATNTVNPPADTTPPPDATPPNGTLTGKTAQDVDKLALSVGSDEAASASGQASVNVPGAKKPVTSKPAAGDVPANGKVKLRFKFKKSALKKIKKTIARGKKPKAKLNVTVTDAVGNATTLEKRVKLKD